VYFSLTACDVARWLRCKVVAAFPKLTQLQASILADRRIRKTLLKDTTEHPQPEEFIVYLHWRYNGWDQHVEKIKCYFIYETSFEDFLMVLQDQTRTCREEVRTSAVPNSPPSLEVDDCPSPGPTPESTAAALDTPGPPISGSLVQSKPLDDPFIDPSMQKVVTQISMAKELKGSNCRFDEASPALQAFPKCTEGYSLVDGPWEYKLFAKTRGKGTQDFEVKLSV